MTGPEGAHVALDDELDRVVALATEARDALGDQRGGPVHLLTTAGPAGAAGAVRRAVADEDAVVVVGTFHEAPVGYAIARVARLEAGERLGVVDELFVEPDARRVGVGAALLEAVLDWCRERGCLGVDAVALPGDRATKNFFEGFGLVARAIVAHRSLEEGPE